MLLITHPNTRTLLECRLLVIGRSVRIYQLSAIEQHEQVKVHSRGPRGHHWSMEHLEHLWVSSWRRRQLKLSLLSLTLPSSCVLVTKWLTLICCNFPARAAVGLWLRWRRQRRVSSGFSAAGFSMPLSMGPFYDRWTLFHFFSTNTLFLLFHRLSANWTSRLSRQQDSAAVVRRSVSVIAPVVLRAHPLSPSSPPVLLADVGSSAKVTTSE